LKGRTEFTPRAYAAFSSIRTPTPKEQTKLANRCEPPDVYNPAIRPPLGEIDVLNIMDPKNTGYYATASDHYMIMKPGKRIWRDGMIDS
jgi:hypothetical protein